MVAMKIIFSVRSASRALTLAVVWSLGSLAWAGPGAHGPNGEHLETPTAVSGTGLPRVEAHSELFELVGQLHEGELSLLIDRYESNEPVLEAQVEVESGGLKAVAKFHADHGDYAVDDERLLALLRQPGEHALVFTIVKGADSDLLDGSLQRPMAVAPPEHADGGGWWWVLLPVVVALAAGAYVFMQRRARARGLPQLGERA
jgi:hypothetical protein